jgi:hypothetical protein
MQKGVVMISEAEIIAQIAQGENQQQEFKRLVQIHSAQ